MSVHTLMEARAVEPSSSLWIRYEVIFSIPNIPSQSFFGKFLLWDVLPYQPAHILDRSSVVYDEKL